MKKIENKQAASITVYFCLALVLCGALILGLVEKLRWEGLDTNAAEWTNLAAESLFAGYQPLLFQEYELFLLDGSFGNEKVDVEAAEDWMQALIYDAAANLKSGDKGNFYRMQVSDVTVRSYTLVTDQNGSVFIRQAAETMKTVLGKRAAKELFDSISEIQDKEKEGGDPEQSITDAENTLTELMEQESTGESGESGAKGAANGSGAPSAKGTANGSGEPSAKGAANGDAKDKGAA